MFLDSKPTDVIWRLDDDGKKIRVSSATGRVIPTPGAHLKIHEDGTDMGKYVSKY